MRFTCPLFVIAAIPIHKVGDARLHSGIWFVTHVCDQTFHISVSIRDIAGLQRQHVHDCLFAEVLLQQFNKTHEFDGVIVANIVEAVGRAAGAGVWCIAIRFRIRRSGMSEGANPALYDVVNIGKIATMFAIAFITHEIAKQLSHQLEKYVDAVLEREGPGKLIYRTVVMIMQVPVILMYTLSLGQQFQ